MGHRTNLYLHYNTKDKKCKELQKGEKNGKEILLVKVERRFF